MLTQLKIYHVRNLSDIHVPLGQVNVFIGDNGSGKTSLLEAVYLLSRGKSFRHFEPKRYISHGKESCTVWASGTNETLAITKQKDATTHLRHNQNSTSQAALTKRLPTLVIDPSSMGILEEGSTQRRQLLDFLCFHGDQHFHSVWLEYQRALKQRNSLLKQAQTSPATRPQLCAWDSVLSAKAEQLHAIRQAVFGDWRQKFEMALADLLPKYAHQITLSYHAGYDPSTPLAQTLAARLESDIEAGYTRMGAHRADLSIAITTTHKDNKTHKEQAIHVLSRGQKKLLITALKLSGLPFLCQSGQTPIVLVDDLDSELDGTASLCLMQALLKMPCQIFVSSLSPAIVQLIQEANQTHKSQAVFTLDGGCVIPMTTTQS